MQNASARFASRASWVFRLQIAQRPGPKEFSVVEVAKCIRPCFQKIMVGRSSKKKCEKENWKILGLGKEPIQAFKDRINSALEKLQELSTSRTTTFVQPSKQYVHHEFANWKTIVWSTKTTKKYKKLPNKYQKRPKKYPPKNKSQSNTNQKPTKNPPKTRNPPTNKRFKRLV